MKKYIALVPAYEPEVLMIDLLQELSCAKFETVVIDDGSGDAYAALFKKATDYATVLSHPQNMGKGQGIRTGLDYIKHHYGNDCIVVTVDADGQHKVSDALKLCQLAESSPNTLFLGSRKLTGKIPFRSRFGNGMTRFVYRLSTGLKVHDTQTGLRAFGGELIDRMLQTEGNRYEYEMNILLEFAREKRPIEEMEIETIYLNNNEASHFNAVRDSFRIYKEILKFSASSFIGFLVDYILFSVLVLLLKNTSVSNIIARIASASVNFTINKRFVFKNQGSLLKSAISYFLLAACILAGNTAVLYLLTDVCAINPLLAKIITEIVFFFVSWTVQKFFVFKGKNPKRHKGK